MIISVPNLLSLFRPISAVFMLCFGHLCTPFFLAGLVFFAVVTDLLDGYLARVLSCESAFGAMLDPICDAIFIVSILSYAVLYLHLPGIYWIVLLVRYMVIGLYHLELWCYGYDNLSALCIGKWSSALTMMSLLGYFLQHAGVDGVVFHLFFSVTIGLTTVMLFLSWFYYYQRYLQLWYIR